MFVAVSDSPQLNCHHSGSFEVANIFTRIAIVQDVEMIAATSCDNGFADRCVFMDCHYSVTRCAGEYGVSRFHDRVSGTAPISPRSVTTPRFTSSRVGRAGARRYTANI